MDAFAKKNQINENVLDLSENIFACINEHLLFMSIKTFQRYIRKGYTISPISTPVLPQSAAVTE